MKTTDSERTGETAARARQESAAARDGARIFASTSAAIDRTERLLCGDGVVRSVAVAEGLALAGSHAATSLGAGAPRPGPSVPRSEAAWVHHRVAGPGTALRGAAAFELLAADAGEAVAHTLAARRMVRLLGRPGICSIEAAAADRPCHVRLPDAREVSAVLDDRSTCAGGVSAAADRVLGRRGILPTYRVDDATLLLVAAGEDRLRAHRLVDRLRRRGLTCGVVGVAMVHPFPAAELRAALAGCESVWVVTPAVGEDAAEAARAAGCAAIVDHRSAGGELLLPPELAERFPANAGRAAVATHEADDRSAVALAVDPPDPEALRAAVAAASEAGWAEPWNVIRLSPGADPAGVVLGRDSTCAPPARIDVGVIVRPAADDGRRAGALLSRLDRRSTLLLVTDDDRPLDTWRALGPARRAAITGGRPATRWISMADWSTVSADLARLIRERFAGARSQPADGTLRSIPIDVETVEAELRAEAATVGGEAASPVMPEVALVERSSVESWEFHRTAPRCFDERPLGGPLVPWAAVGLGAATPEWRAYPFVLDARGVGAGHAPLDVLLQEAIEHAGDGLSSGILSRRRPTVLRLANRTASASGSLAPPAELVRAALSALPDELDLSEAGRAELQREIATVEPRMPAGGRAVGFDERTLDILLAETLVARRAPARAEFRRCVEQLVERLDELLRIDDGHRPQAASPAAIAPTLGAGERFVDPERLSRHLPAYRGSAPLEPERRARIERSRATLRSWLDAGGSSADLILVQTTALGPDPRPRCRVVVHPDPLRAAVGLWDGLARSMVEPVRALRTARLDVSGHYEPERHDRPIAALDPLGFSAEDMLQIPAVVVRDDERPLGEDALGAFSALLRSGRPVHVLATRRATDVSLSRDTGPGYDPGTGYLALAHREAFVIQTSLTRPATLTEAFERMAIGLRPSVALVTEPDWDGPIEPWRQLVLAEFGRDPYHFRYDPAAGPSWAERFDIDDNPQPAAGWPRHSVEQAGTARGASVVEPCFTMADLAAAVPRSRGHFRTLSANEWASDQTEIGSYCELEPTEQLR
ncbi:MAG TPA: hypothetical protein VD788_09825, partial [Candidatus Polarisedimenticolaceae bacterium]|nr:hypothetical protein [Candidatus Polarisedimenticolaceae bacterium]